MELASRQGHKEVVNLLLDTMLKLTCRKMKGSWLYSLHVKKSTSHGQCIALICSSLLPHCIIWSMLIIVPFYNKLTLARTRMA